MIAKTFAALFLTLVFGVFIYCAWPALLFFGMPVVIMGLVTLSLEILFES